MAGNEEPMSMEIKGDDAEREERMVLIGSEQLAGRQGDLRTSPVHRGQHTSPETVIATSVVHAELNPATGQLPLVLRLFSHSQK